MARHSDASLRPRLSFLATLFLALPGLGACGDDGEGGSGGAGGSSSSTSSTSTTSATTTTGGSGGSGTGGGAIDCDDAAACAYPSKGLGFSEREIVVEDAEMGRALPVLARIPDAEGPLPLVIWSHGGGFLPNVPPATAGWSTTFAQQGYAVLTLAHIPPTAEGALALCDLASIPIEDCSADAVAGDEDANGLVALVKTRDVIAVLDALPGLSDASVDLGGPAIDLDRVILAGWSAGSRPGLVTLVATFLPLPGMSPLSMADVRPAAAFALSPTGPGFGGFYEEEGSNSWSDVRGPVLVITGDNDVKPTKPDLNGPVRRRGFENQPEDGSRWMLYSSLEPGVGGHGTYNLEDRNANDERLADLSIAIESTALAFVDANVMGDAEAEAWLASDRARLIAGEAEWVHR